MFQLQPQVVEVAYALVRSRDRGRGLFVWPTEVELGDAVSGWSFAQCSEALLLARSLWGELCLQRAVEKVAGVPRCAHR